MRLAANARMSELEVAQRCDEGQGFLAGAGLLRFVGARPVGVTLYYTKNGLRVLGISGEYRPFLERGP
jgi:hypothetical protein